MSYLAPLLPRFGLKKHDRSFYYTYTAETKAFRARKDDLGWLGGVSDGAAFEHLHLSALAMLRQAVGQTWRIWRRRARARRALERSTFADRRELGLSEAAVAFELERRPWEGHSLER